MAYSAAKNASGTYDVSQDGQKITTGASNILGNYGLSESQLSSTPLPANQSQQSILPAVAESTAGQNANANYFQNGGVPSGQNIGFGQVNNTQNIQNGLNTAQNQVTDISAQIAQKYKQGLGTAQASGQPTPTTQGGGSAMVNSATGGATQMPQVNPVDGLLSQDKGYQDLVNLQKEYNNSQNQQKLLTDTYNQMYKDSGIEGIDTELINSKNIIDGTEQDIRNEISAVGGFGTESQVQALAGARNKTLIKNYNTLLQTKQNALDHINTMIGLTGQDRQYAQQQFENSFNIQQQLNNYRDKFVSNAKEGYNAIVSKVGYAGLLQSLNGDPNAISLVEKTMGFVPGGLEQAAAYVEPMSEMDKLDLEGKKLSNAKLRAELNAPKGGSKLLSVSEAKELGVPYGTTEEEAAGMGITPSSVGNGVVNNSPINPTTGKVDPRSQIANVIKTTGAKTDDKLKLTGSVVSAIQDLAERNKTGSVPGISFLSAGPTVNAQASENQSYLSALEGSVESWMTGASVSEDQQKRIKKDLIPKKGDLAGTVRKKLNGLANYMMSYAAGSLSTQGVDWSPEQIDFFAPVTVTGPDGEDYEFTN